MRASLRLLLTHRLLWSFIGVTALSCLVWMLGPFWSWGESRPLEPVLPRQLTVSALYFLWILFQLIPSLYRAWFNSRLLTQLQLSGNDDPAERQMTEERLNQRFSEAAMQLKRT
ncbi:MAG TPA: type VI secretion system membrane subunit TssM, partial [Pantoea agglomerans]|nr:type VI secretion system membrane subunit TssM [Pantoea agglomerans]